MVRGDAITAAPPEEQKANRSFTSILTLRWKAIYRSADSAVWSKLHTQGLSLHCAPEDGVLKSGRSPHRLSQQPRAPFKGEVYIPPLMLEDENCLAHGNDWARGFMRGMHMRHDGWAELMDDEEHGGCLVPMMMLFHEHDEDPEMRPEPISNGTARRRDRSRSGWAF